MVKLNFNANPDKIHKCSSIGLKLFKEIREELNIPDKWDMILFGDGSGSMSDLPGGWACFGVEKEDDGSVVFHDPVYGAASNAPINWMEAMPFWHFLRDHLYTKEGKKKCEERRRNVYLVTDSQWAETVMSGGTKAKVHEDMQRIYQWIQEQGYNLRWSRVPRETLVFHSWADRMAAMAREYIKALEAPAEFTETCHQ